MARSLRCKMASLALCCGVVATSPAAMMASTVTQKVNTQKEVVQGEQIDTDVIDEGDTDEEYGAVTLPLEPDKDYGIVSLPLEKQEEERLTQLVQEVIEEPIMPEDGEYTIQMKVWHETKDEDSMSADFFDKEAILSVRNGQGTLTVTVTTTAFGIPNAITKLEQRLEDNGVYDYDELAVIPIEGTDKIQVTIPIESIGEASYVRCSIIVGMKPVLRLIPQIETLERVDEEQAIKLNIEKTDLTNWGKQDGTIKIVDAQGVGDWYEYSIDGGETWSEENYYEGLAAGEYEVLARDKRKIYNQSSLELVVIEGLNQGLYSTDIQVLKEEVDEPSMSQMFFKKEDLVLEVQDGKGTLTLEVAKDGMGMMDVISGISQRIGEEYIPLELVNLDNEEIRTVTAQVVFEAQNEDIYLSFNIANMHSGAILRIRLDNISQNGEIVNPSPQEKVEINVQTTDASRIGSQDGTITVQATGGKGEYDYTINKGEAWQTANLFESLVAGTYEVAARDSKGNQSDFVTVTIKEKVTTPVQGLQDGQYSVDIRVLQETTDSESMAAQFFNKEGLPLEVIGGKGYLTIQLLKDGMGMKDVISSLEQKTSTGYTDLYLNYLNDSSTRYVTTQVVFEDINQDIYLRCGIVPVAPMKPALRVQLIEDSIQEGLGSINKSLQGQEVTAISKVVAENGKVTITLSQEDETLTLSDFTAKIYKENTSTGTDITLKEFKMDGTTITFTYDEIQKTEVEQKFSIGISLNELETKSNVFSVLAIGQTMSLLKENAMEIKYIKGYEDGTFRPSKEVTKAEALSMLASLINVPDKAYQTATIDVFQADKDTESIAKQFFKTDYINVVEENGKYYVELEIANEGVGFTNIINSVEHKVSGEYSQLEVIKTADLKKAYVKVEVDNLKDPIILRTGIAPMGNVKPELRVIIKEIKDSEYTSQFTDIEMWAKEDIMLFEKLGVIGEEKEALFNPNQQMTRGEFAKIIASVMGLELNTEDNSFKPNHTITRAEIVTLINRVIGHSEETNLVLDEESKSPFEDLEAVHWAYQDIIKVTQQ